jgi:uncharacterized protein YdcH (DUF465 family)
MNSYIEALVKRHRRLNRLIDNCKTAGRQEEIKVLKRIRLKLKDKIAAVPKQPTLEIG